MGLFGLGIIQSRRESRRNYNALRVGMNVCEVPWPKGELVAAFCELGKSDLVIRKDAWHDVSIGHRTLPSECRKMRFSITGKFLEHATYSIELDEKWNILNIGPLVLYGI
jgi:hypothetical protein